MSFKSLVRELYRVKAIRKGKLCCADCGRHVRRHDRYTILTVKHISCTDPKQVGQTVLPMVKQ